MATSTIQAPHPGTVVGNPDDELSPQAVAAQYKTSVWSLARYRKDGIGPEYRQTVPGGTVTYIRCDVEAWLYRRSRGAR